MNLTSSINSLPLMPYLPPPRFVGLAQILQLTIAGNKVRQTNTTALGGEPGQRQRRIEVGERPIYKTDTAESI